MQLLRRHRHAFVRLALVAMLALACVPTLSRWITATQGPLAWAAVCTPQGMKALAGDDTAPLAGLAGAGHLDACGYCALAAGATPPPVDAAAHDAATGVGPLPALAPPPARIAWAAFQSRAPPALS